MDLPLQKHCSKKLFSIPEVTEEEDEEEENPAPSAACKASPCNVDIPKCHYMKSYKAITQKPVAQACPNFSTEQCGRGMSANSSKAERCVDDCLFQDWPQRTGGCVSQSLPYLLKSAESPTWNTKKNSNVNERSHCVAEPNRKKQSEGREHCSRLSSNPNPAIVSNSRGHDVSEPVFCGPTRESAQLGHRSVKVSRSNRKRQPLVPTNVKTKSRSTFSSRYMEIDIEYDTEDEDDLSVPTYPITRSKADIWEDSSQTDREGWSESSDYSEPITFPRRKVKKQPKLQTGTTDGLKRHTSLLHIDQIHGGHQGSNKEDQNSRAASNKPMRTVRWEGAQKVTLGFPMLTVLCLRVPASFSWL